METNFSDLYEYDFNDDSGLSVAIDKYSSGIGYFLIRFSSLEHELDLSLIEIFGRSSDAIGHLVIEKVTTSNKIDLFSKLSLLTVNETVAPNLEADLKKIVSRLNNLNTFRNKVVHANWQTLSRDSFVITEIYNHEGSFSLKRVKITPFILKKMSSEAFSLKKDFVKFNTNLSKQLM